jgi:hypothetical protein
LFAELGGGVIVKHCTGRRWASGWKPGFELVSRRRREGDRSGVARRRASSRIARVFDGARGAVRGVPLESFAGPAGTKFELDSTAGTKGKKRVTLTCDKSAGCRATVARRFRRRSSCRSASATRTASFRAASPTSRSANAPAICRRRLDTALAKIGDAPGLILDMRANNGGGTDHERCSGGSSPKARVRAVRRAREGAHFTGPLVVIVGRRHALDGRDDLGHVQGRRAART